VSDKLTPHALPLGLRMYGHRKQLEHADRVGPKHADAGDGIVLVQGGEVPTSGGAVLLEPATNKFRCEWAQRKTEEPQVLRGIPNREERRKELLEVSGL
jgi:hypothetical protein